jgi:hypothetical protein
VDTQRESPGKTAIMLTLPRQVINDKYADVLDAIYAASR